MSHVDDDAVPQKLPMACPGRAGRLRTRKRLNRKLTRMWVLGMSA